MPLTLLVLTLLCAPAVGAKVLRKCLRRGFEATSDNFLTLSQSDDDGALWLFGGF